MRENDGQRTVICIRNLGVRWKALSPVRLYNDTSSGASTFTPEDIHLGRSGPLNGMDSIFLRESRMLPTNYWENNSSHPCTNVRPSQCLQRPTTDDDAGGDSFNIPSSSERNSFQGDGSGLSTDILKVLWSHRVSSSSGQLLPCDCSSTTLFRSRCEGGRGRNPFLQDGSRRELVPVAQL
jgi:hypothetical protein